MRGRAKIEGFYGIVDPSICRPNRATEVAAEILEGGCCALQLRAKECSDEEYLELGTQLVKLCRRYRVPFFVNDRVDLALILESDGVHLGQDDLPVRDARRLLGPKPLLGWSTHSLEQVQAAHALELDLIGVGPVFPTSTKKLTSPGLGTHELERLRRSAGLPVVAIGGITLENVKEIQNFEGMAVAAISSVCRAPSPRAAAARLNKIALQRRHDEQL
ncbi:MAG: thiamine phosphate synthase [Myxococcota bacterium]